MFGGEIVLLLWLILCVGAVMVAVVEAWIEMLRGKRIQRDKPTMRVVKR